MCRGSGQHSAVMFLANGGKGVGWGHIMRCCSIARSIEELGAEVLFVVMNSESASLVASLGFDSWLLDASSALEDEAAQTVRSLALEREARSILVDTYAVTDSFFHALHASNIEVGYVDDLYLEGVGGLETPKPFEADLIVNYGFMFEDSDYEALYSDRLTRCLIGPAYAPVRRSFVGLSRSIEPKVKRILVTSGSTNPNRAVERMLSACGYVSPDIEVHVVVGKNARIDFSGIDAERLHLHEGVSDLSALMMQTDVAVTSASSTLYELACVGVPTIALPVVENQLFNAKGFIKRKLGFAIPELDWTSARLSEMIEAMICEYDARQEFSERMQLAVDGRGSERIARQLLGLDS